MKTLYVTNVPSATDNHLNILFDRFHQVNESLPKPVYQEKLFQALFQIPLLGYDSDAYGFYETSLEEGRKLNPDDPKGSISVRIDYDPNNTEALAEGEVPDWQPAIVFDSAVMCLCQPNGHPQFPEKGLIDHIRVAIKVSDDVVIERTFWATQYYLLNGLPEGHMFGTKVFDPEYYK